MGAFRMMEMTMEHTMVVGNAPFEQVQQQLVSTLQMAGHSYQVSGGDVHFLPVEEELANYVKYCTGWLDKSEIPNKKDMIYQKVHRGQKMVLQHHKLCFGGRSQGHIARAWHVHPSSQVLLWQDARVFRRGLQRRRHVP